MEFGIITHEAPSEAVKAISTSGSAEVKLVDTKLKITQNQFTFEETLIYIQVIKLVNSYYVWIGSAPAKMQSLHMSVVTKAETEPVTTCLLGHQSESAGQSISAKLTKKTGKQFLVSYNISETIPHIKEFVEKKILQEIGGSEVKN